MPGDPPSACKCLWLLECWYRTEGAAPDSCHRPSRPLRSPSLRRLPLPAGFDPPPPERGLRSRRDWMRRFQNRRCSIWIQKVIIEVFLCKFEFPILQSMINIQKQIDYWIKGADDDLVTADLLIRGTRILHGLFFCHLVIEKSLKAHYVKKNGDVAPRTHNLVILSEKSGLE